MLILNKMIIIVCVLLALIILFWWMYAQGRKVDYRIYNDDEKNQTFVDWQKRAEVKTTEYEESDFDKEMKYLNWLNDEKKKSDK